MCCYLKKTATSWSYLYKIIVLLLDKVRLGMEFKLDRVDYWIRGTSFYETNTYK